MLLSDVNRDVFVAWRCNSWTVPERWQPTNFVLDAGCSWNLFVARQSIPQLQRDVIVTLYAIL